MRTLARESGLCDVMIKKQSTGLLVAYSLDQIKFNFRAAAPEMRGRASRISTAKTAAVLKIETGLIKSAMTAQFWVVRTKKIKRGFAS